MKKIKIGDYFETKTSDERTLLQYVHSYKTIGELVRVLPKHFSSDQEDFESEEDEFFIIPLKKAYKQGIVNFVGNIRIPRSLILSYQMKSRKINNDGGLISYQRIDYDAWHKKNKKELSDDEKTFLLREQGML